MSFPLPVTVALQKVAAGNIRPARILAMSTTVEDAVVEATGKSVPLIGISANQYKYPPGSVEQVGVPFTAETGDMVSYRGPGQVAEVLSGAAISRLDYPLTSDNAGRAISVTIPSPLGGTPANNVPTYIVGYPVDTAAAANEQIRCNVVQSIPLYVGT